MTSNEVRYVESYRLEGSVRCVDGSLVFFIAPPDEPDAGVREPRRPKPKSPTPVGAE